MLSSDELLAGGRMTFEIEVPAVLLDAGSANGTTGANVESNSGSVRLRPLTVNDLQIISRAAKESDSLVATLMVQRALVEPEMTVTDVAMMPAGLVHFLLSQVNRISGISATADQLSSIADAPLTKASFILAKEFGWTPQQVSELTLGQVLLHLHMLGKK